MGFLDFQKKLQVFAKERNWEQFHRPKNLVMALNGEVGELNEIFQWLSDEEASLKKQDLDVARELADIQLYLLRLFDVLEIDIEKALNDKMQENSNKYPVDKSFGNAKKYDEL